MREITDECHDLQLAATRGELGTKIALLVLPAFPCRYPADESEFWEKNPGTTP